MITTYSVTIVSLAFGLMTLPSVFGQGSLLPPPGPPAPTMKRLDQIEPRTIINAANTPGDAENTFIVTVPGSYYLTGDIAGEAGKHGISIQADDVTLDLNGFALVSGGGIARGINVPAAQINFCLRNGSLRGWTYGVRADQARNTLAEQLRLSNNTGVGLYVGLGSMIKDCVATENGTGFQTPDRCQISNCIATVNAGWGFLCGSYVTLIDCTSSRNSFRGIDVGSSCNVIRCSSTRNNEHGLTAQAGSTIADCVVNANGGDGISVTNSTTVRNCTTQGNVEEGIFCEASCHVFGNTSDGNRNGIFANTHGNRIDGNSCSSNTAGGITVSGTRNVIVRNNARANTTNYWITGSENASGPIVDTGGGPITTNSPWANFIH